MERQAKSRLKNLWNRFSRHWAGHWDRIFRDRELFVRVGGRMRYLQLSRRRQIFWAAGALGLAEDFSRDKKTRDQKEGKG